MAESPASESPQSVEFDDETAMDELPVRKSTGGMMNRFRQRAQQRLSKDKPRNSKSVKLVHLPKHTAGLFWTRILKNKLQMYHPTFSQNYQLTFLALQLPWAWLLVAYFVTAFTLATIMAGLFWAGDCHLNLTFSQVFLIVSQQVMTGPAYMEMTDQPTETTNDGCIVVGVFSSMISLFFQTFVISVVIRKYMKPKSTVAFSRRLVFNMRNGVPCLQARVFNLRGTLMTNVRLTAHHAYPRTTLEGETHWNTAPLKFTGPHFSKLPGTYTHLINEESALYKAYKSGTVTGSITFEFIGYDTILHEDIYQIWMFWLPHDAAPCSRYADVVTKGSQAAINDGTMQMQVDMGRYDAIVPTHGTDRCCLLCMRGCVFGSAAARKQKSDAAAASTNTATDLDVVDSSASPVESKQTVSSEAPVARGDSIHSAVSVVHAPVQLNSLNALAEQSLSTHESGSAHDLLAGADADDTHVALV
eukprot:m.229650 g.229650  ORF g.229650 m.229650 type:complete len:473 (-) comp17344_c0_seq2:973-2391(-)